MLTTTPYENIGLFLVSGWCSRPLHL